MAARDIAAGEVLLTERAAAALLFPEHWGDTCWRCLQGVGAAVPCPGCTAAVFCSDACLHDATAAFHRCVCVCVCVSERERERERA